MESYEKPFAEYINFAMEEIMNVEMGGGMSLEGGLDERD